MASLFLPLTHLATPMYMHMGWDRWDGGGDCSCVAPVSSLSALTYSLPSLSHLPSLPFTTLAHTTPTCHTCLGDPGHLLDFEAGFLYMLSLPHCYPLSHLPLLPLPSSLPALSALTCLCHTPAHILYRGEGADGRLRLAWQHTPPLLAFLSSHTRKRNLPIGRGLPPSICCFTTHVSVSLLSVLTSSCLYIYISVFFSLLSLFSPSSSFSHRNRNFLLFPLPSHLFSTFETDTGLPCRTASVGPRCFYSYIHIYVCPTTL